MKWVLFDYGVGNLHSLKKALEAAGATCQITTDANELAHADVAVLPGVGAFGHVMKRLAPAAASLRRRHAEGRPIVGICIGHQVLYERSDESPEPGLGILPGHVQKLQGDKIPHMGWNTLEGGPFDGEHVYYVHSYAAKPDHATTATTSYGSVFAAAVRQGNTFGFQFHPEKSSRIGQQILQSTISEVEAL